LQYNFPARQGAQITRKDNFLMNRMAEFGAQHVTRLTLVSALLFLAVAAYAPLPVASASNQLLGVSPALFPPQGILLVYSERYVVEDDGVLVYRRRPVELYTDSGQLVGVYAQFGDAPIRLDVAPGNYIVAFQNDGRMQKIRAYVKDGEETIVPTDLVEQPTPPASVSSQ